MADCRQSGPKGTGDVGGCGMAAHAGILERLGFHPERFAQQRESRLQVRFRVSAHWVPVLPGAIASWYFPVHQEPDQFPSAVLPLALATALPHGYWVTREQIRTRLELRRRTSFPRRKSRMPGIFRTTGNLSPKLTLNLGLRYELFSPIWRERFGRQSTFDYDRLALVIPEGQRPGSSIATQLRYTHSLRSRLNAAKWTSTSSRGIRPTGHPGLVWLGKRWTEPW